MGRRIPLAVLSIAGGVKRGLVTGVPIGTAASTPVARPDAARRGSGAHARGPSRALHAEHERAAALVPVRGRARWLRTSGALASVARDGELDARHAAQRSFLKAGPRWLLALGGFGLAGRVGPRTSRPSRGRANGSGAGVAVVAGRAPGTATFRSARLSVGGLAPPDNGAPRYRKSRALVLGHARARPRGAPAVNGHEELTPSGHPELTPCGQFQTAGWAWSTSSCEARALRFSLSL